MAEVLQYDIDFNTEIRKGATAELLVEELWQDGKLVKLGAAKILLFTNKGNEYQAIRFTNSRDVTAYYDSNGVSRESPFLRSPLAFSGVTSNFNPKEISPHPQESTPPQRYRFWCKNRYTCPMCIGWCRNICRSKWWTWKLYQRLNT